MTKGWRNESHRHSLSAKGIRTVPRKFFMSSWGVPTSRFFKLDTGIPMQQEMMDNPDYFREHKGVEWKIVWLSPDDYIEAIDVGFSEGGRRDVGYSDVSQRLSKGHIEKIMGIMAGLEELGKKMDMPYLRYDVYRGKPYFSQEGHHRVVASRLLGEERIPVFVEYPADEEEFDMVREHMLSTVKMLVNLQ